MQASPLKEVLLLLDHAHMKEILLLDGLEDQLIKGAWGLFRHVARALLMFACL